MSVILLPLFRGRGPRTARAAPPAGRVSLASRRLRGWDACRSTRQPVDGPLLAKRPRDAVDVGRSQCQFSCFPLFLGRQTSLASASFDRGPSSHGCVFALRLKRFWPLQLVRRYTSRCAKASASSRQRRARAARVSAALLRAANVLCAVFFGSSWSTSLL